MLSLFGSLLQSSYGPNGHSKVVRGPTGTIYVTRDGTTMLEHMLEGTERAGSPLQRLMLEACIGVSQRFGDGALGTVILVDSLLRSLCMGERVRSLMAINAVSFVVQRFEDDITDGMVRCGYWKSLEEAKWIRGLWMTALVPAMSASSAQVLERLLWKWLGANDGLQHQQASISSSSRPSPSLPAVLQRCEDALSDFELLVLPMLREGYALSDSFVAEPDELFISGNCRDHSALTRAASSPGISFLCIKQLVQRHEPNSTLTAEVTVMTASLSSLLTTKPSGRLSQIRSLAELLLGAGIDAIFCADRIEEEAEAELFELASRGIVVTDCVPENHLARLARLARCNLWISAAEAMSGVAETGGCLSVKGLAAGRLGRVERVMMRSADISLRISGIGCGESSGLGVGGSGQRVCQLLLRCGSSAMSIVYTRLLRRCLLIAVSALRGRGHDADDDDKAGGAEGVQYGSSTDKQYSCLIPGAGAGDVSWSALWSLVAEALLTVDCQSPSPSPSPSPSSSSSQEGVSDPLKSLASGLAERLAAYLGSMLGAEGPVFVSGLLRTSALCLAISEAYLQPPLLLLKNHRHAGESGSGSGSGSGTSEHSLQHALLLWRQQRDGGGYQGWVSFIGSHAGNVASLADSFEHGVVGSSRQHWASFKACLHACTVFLRVGGSFSRVSSKKSSIHVERRSGPRSGD